MSTNHQERETIYIIDDDENNDDDSMLMEDQREILETGNVIQTNLVEQNDSFRSFLIFSENFLTKLLYRQNPCSKGYFFMIFVLSTVGDVNYYLRRLLEKGAIFITCFTIDNIEERDEYIKYMIYVRFSKKGKPEQDLSDLCTEYTKIWSLPSKNKGMIVEVMKRLGRHYHTYSIYDVDLIGNAKDIMKKEKIKYKRKMRSISGRGMGTVSTREIPSRRTNLRFVLPRPPREEEVIDVDKEYPEYTIIDVDALDETHEPVEQGRSEFTLIQRRVNNDDDRYLSENEEYALWNDDTDFSRIYFENHREQLGERQPVGTAMEEEDIRNQSEIIRDTFTIVRNAFPPPPENNGNNANNENNQSNDLSLEESVFTLRTGQQSQWFLDLIEHVQNENPPLLFQFPKDGK